MVLEATILCIDNSEYVRNSDYLPTRLQVRARRGQTRMPFRSERFSPSVFLAVTTVQQATGLGWSSRLSRGPDPKQRAPRASSLA